MEIGKDVKQCCINREKKSLRWQDILYHIFIYASCSNLNTRAFHVKEAPYVDYGCFYETISEFYEFRSTTDLRRGKNNSNKH